MSQNSLPVVSLTLSLAPELNISLSQPLPVVGFEQIIAADDSLLELAPPPLERVDEANFLTNIAIFQELMGTSVPPRFVSRGGSSVQSTTQPQAPASSKPHPGQDLRLAPDSNVPVQKPPLPSSGTQPPMDPLPPGGRVLPVVVPQVGEKTPVTVQADPNDTAVSEAINLREAHKALLEYPNHKVLVSSTTNRKETLPLNIKPLRKEPIPNFENRSLSSPNQVLVSQGVDSRLTTTPTIPMSRQFGQTKAWTEEVTQRIAWMTQSNMPVARLKLDPPDLGLVDVRISVNQDQATVNFSSPTPEVRAVLEAALPRLQSLLQDTGLQLNHASVGHQDSRDQTRQSESMKTETLDQDELAEDKTHVIVISDNLVDVYI